MPICDIEIELLHNKIAEPSYSSRAHDSTTVLLNLA